MNRVLTAAVVLLCTASIASAQGQGGRPPQGKTPPSPQQSAQLWIQTLESLKLDESQKTQLSGIFEKYQAQTKSDQDALQKARASKDKAGMMSARDKMLEKRKQAEPKMEKEVLDVLTPEQQAEYRKIKAEREKRMQDMKMHQDSMRNAAGRGR